MGLGIFRGLDFTFPDGTEAKVESFEVTHDMNIRTSDERTFTLRATVNIINKELRGSVELLDSEGTALTHEDLDQEGVKQSLSDCLYWLVNADSPELDS